MQKAVAAFQLAIVIAIIAYATFELFRGNFSAAMSCFPLLVIFYLFLAYRRRTK